MNFLKSYSLFPITTDIYFQKLWFRIAQTTLNMTSISIYSVSSSDNSNFIFADYESIVNIYTLSYTNASSPFLYSITSQVTSDGLIISNCVTYQEWLLILSAPATSISNSRLSYSSSNNSTTSFSILSSTVNLLSNVKINNMDQYAVSIKSSNITLTTGLTIESTYGVYAKDSNFAEITNSTFQSNGRGTSNTNAVSVKGGAAYFENSNFTILLSSFSNNTSKYGAGVYISWQLSPVCVTTISNTIFTDNVAQISGGGVMYDLYRPTMSSLVFDNNNALYGPNIASYAIKIKIGNTTQNTIIVDNAVSGQISQAFTFSILDYDNQAMNLDSASKITIKAQTAGAQINGKSIQVADAGIVKLSELIFINSPGSRNVQFSVNSDSINLNYAKAIYGSNYTLPVITVNFRFCRPGEYVSQKQCVSCSQNSYSLFWNSTQCEQWMSNVNWEGDEVLNVNAGYWRKSTNSTIIVQWPNSNAWNGGYNTTSTYPVNCATGYQSILCAKWMKDGDTKYEKVSNFQCTKWAAPIVIYIRVIGMMVAFILVILFIIYLKRKEGNERTILMRIMANYVQIMTTTLAYNMDLPNVVSNVFTPLQILGSGTTTVFSFDCFSSNSEFTLFKLWQFTPSPTIFKMFMMALTPILLCVVISIVLGVIALVFSFDCFSSNSEFTLFTPSPTIFKMFMMALTPILLCVVISIVLGVIALATRTSLNDFKRNLVASNVVILFLILPTLIDTGLALFQCIEIDTGDFRVSADLDIVWYSAEHILWWFMLSMPILVVWVFGTQFLILLYLIKHRRRLNSTAVKKYFYIIYIGYRDERFYWEFVNTFKKFMIISLNVFLSQVSKAYKGMAAIITLLVLARLQMYLKPYKLKINNEIENSSMVAIGFTLYGGLLFFKGQSQVSFIEAFAGCNWFYFVWRFIVFQRSITSVIYWSFCIYSNNHNKFSIYYVLDLLDGKNIRS